MTAPEPETAADAPAIDALLDRCFGLTRRTKASYRLREGSAPVPGLSLVTRSGGHVSATISFWPIVVGSARTPALLLGPLAVHPDFQNRGLGLTLMREGLARAMALGHRLVILVGDEAYYGRVGFLPVPEGRLIMPGPVDPKRLLVRELAPGAFAEVSGLILPPHRATPGSLPALPAATGTTCPAA